MAESGTRYVLSKEGLCLLWSDKVMDMYVWLKKRDSGKTQ